MGLQFVNENHFGDTGSKRTAVFLSGNGPLVDVLQYALKSRVFVQDVHGFLKQYGGDATRAPEEHICVYDEAQRARDSQRVLEKRYVPMNILQGRPLEQKRRVVKDITGAVARVLGVPSDTEDMAVEINEVNPASIAHGGVLTVDMEKAASPSRVEHADAGVARRICRPALRAGSVHRPLSEPAPLPGLLILTG